MMRFSPIVLLMFAMLGCGSDSQPVTLTQEQAVAAIKKLGGRVTFEEESPNKPVIELVLPNPTVPDSGLENLKVLTSL